MELWNTDNYPGHFYTAFHPWLSSVSAGNGFNATAKEENVQTCLTVGILV